MCGITGWVDFGRDLRRHQDVLEDMTATMACRGPDASGTWIDRHAAIGHRRLSVIDLEGGVQPMIEDGDDGPAAVLTLSGEVYNFAELRRELAATGRQFRTRSDTEVVLAAYLQWGAGLADRLNGMYAFAVWDARRQELVLVRDRMGVKPLYYYETADGVVFGSEPKAILANPGIPRRIDAAGMREVLDMVKNPEPAIFAGMREVRPGHLVRVRASGLTRHRYWALDAREHTDDLATTVATVRDLLDDTVARQMVSDVPLCSLLSGGLDSSVVTAIAAREQTRTHGGPVRSFSVDFAGAEANFRPDPLRPTSDAPFVRALARHVGADNTELILSADDLSAPEVGRAVLAATDLPPSYWGDMWPSLYLLFREIRAHSTVALSGESADEVFGGYKWFHDDECIDAGTFPWLAPMPAPFYDGQPLFDPGLIDRLDMKGFRQDSYATALAEVPTLPGESGREKRMREISYLNLTRFLQTLLDRKDRMSMAVGLEVRVPFCDHRLVEYVFNAPWAMKSFDGREKSLLRAATTDLLPESILQRVKSPYPSTQDTGYEQRLRDELARIVADPSSPVLPLLSAEAVRARLHGPLAAESSQISRVDLELPIWMDRWLRDYRVSVELD